MLKLVTFSTAANQQHIVAGELSVKDIMRVEIRQSLGHVMSGVHLNMEGEGGKGFIVFPGSWSGSRPSVP